MKDILLQNLELEKRAFGEFVSSFVSKGISTMVEAGVDFDSASTMVKQACNENLRVTEMKSHIDLLEKTASYITSLESKLESYVEPIKNKSLEKLAEHGFSGEDLEQISNLPENILEKVAGLGNIETAWGMGSPVGPELQTDKQDPITVFALGIKT